MTDLELIRTAPHAMITARPLSDAARQWVDENVDLGGWQTADEFACETTDMANDIMFGAVEAGLACRIIDCGDVSHVGG